MAGSGGERLSMARFDKVIYLLSTTISYDEIGNPIEVITEKKSFTKEKFVGSAEYYNAAAAGLRPERKFEVFTREYKGEAKLKYDGVIYRIIRTSLGKTSEKTWLTCERTAGDN